MKRFLLFSVMAFTAIFATAQISLTTFTQELLPAPTLHDSVLTVNYDTTKVNGNLVVTGKIIANDTGTSKISGLEVDGHNGLSISGGGPLAVTDSAGDTTMIVLPGIINIGGVLNVTDSANLGGNLDVTGNITGHTVRSSDTLWADVGVFSGNVFNDTTHSNVLMSTYIQVGNPDNDLIINANFSSIVAASVSFEAIGTTYLDGPLVASDSATIAENLRVAKNVYADSMFASNIEQKKYTKWAGIIDQVGNQAPDLYGLENNTGMTYTTAYDSTGSYRIICSDTINSAKTLFFCQSHTATIIAIGYLSFTEISIQTYNKEGILTNEMLSNASLEIRIYP